jgi:hypothetical protein
MGPGCHKDRDECSAIVLLLSLKRIFITFPRRQFVIIARLRRLTFRDFPLALFCGGTCLLGRWSILPYRRGLIGAFFRGCPNASPRPSGDFTSGLLQPPKLRVRPSDVRGGTSGNQNQNDRESLHRQFPLPGFWSRSGSTSLTRVCSVNGASSGVSLPRKMPLLSITYVTGRAYGLPKSFATASSEMAAG